VSDATSFPAIGFDAARAAEGMRARGLDGVLLTSPENVFYTTGYTALPSAGNPILYMLRNRLPYFGFVGRDGEVTLICWGFSAEGVQFGADRLVGINDFASASDALAELVREQVGGGVLAVESTCPRWVAGIARDAAGSLADADALMDELRLVKTPAELALIRRSTEIIEAAVDALYDRIEIGMSRLDLMEEARLQLARRGATGISHLTFSFGKLNPEIAIDEPLGPGELVTLDLGAIVDGYCSDNRRYAYTGAIPDELRTRYDNMVAIVDAVGELLVPGATHADIFRRALELHEEHGVQPLERFTHVGHNIGLETEELWLETSPDETIRPGQAINIELYSISEQGLQIGDEETYLISDDGPERISVLPRVIREFA
jgi:Xaa-Pro aminopeptidase